MLVEETEPLSANGLCSNSSKPTGEDEDDILTYRGFCFVKKKQEMGDRESDYKTHEVRLYNERNQQNRYRHRSSSHSRQDRSSGARERDYVRTDRFPDASRRHANNTDEIYNADRERYKTKILSKDAELISVGRTEKQLIEKMSAESFSLRKRMFSNLLGIRKARFELKKYEMDSHNFDLLSENFDRIYWS